MSKMRRVAGVDLSLTSTGLALVTQTTDNGGRGMKVVPGRTFLTTGVVKSDATQITGEHPALYEVRRVEDIVTQLCTSVAGAESVYVEAPAYASRTGKYTERAYLYYSFLAALAIRGTAFQVIPPTTLKKKITGSGRAPKSGVLDTVCSHWANYGWSDTPKGGIHDRADAAGLAWLAALDQGFDVGEPTVTQGR